MVTSENLDTNLTFRKKDIVPRIRRVENHMKTEKEKMLAGVMYDATDPQLTAERRRARDLCKSLNESHKRELLINSR